MNTLNAMVAEVSSGTKRIDGQVMVDRLYDAKCYWAGSIIRIDLKPSAVEPVRQSGEMAVVGAL